MDDEVYNQHFYDSTGYATACSAQCIVPLLMDCFAPRRVADVGCGDGTWLAEFDRCDGVESIIGFDGNAMPADALQIPATSFKRVDFEKDFSNALAERCDLVMSLEVAEHVSTNRAEAFVENLCRMSDVVVFSAAIPFQGGVHHVNENWPEYWAAQFKNQGYVAIDCIRPKIWNNDQVAVWYRQNILVYVKEEMVSRFFPDHDARLAPLFSVIHPYLYFSLLGKQYGEAGYSNSIDFYRKTQAAAHDAQVGFPAQDELLVLASKVDDERAARTAVEASLQALQEQYDSSMFHYETALQTLGQDVKHLAEKLERCRQEHADLEAASAMKDEVLRGLSSANEMLLACSEKPSGEGQKLHEHIQMLEAEKQELVGLVQSEQSARFGLEKELRKARVELIIEQAAVRREGNTNE